MYGKGLIKGLGVTLKRFVNTYLDDIKWLGKRYYTAEGIAHRSSKDANGIFTIQYPEEKLPVPEEFRYIPFLIYDEGENGERKSANSDRLGATAQGTQHCVNPITRP